jgi:ankyrin repeat protein
MEQFFLDRGANIEQASMFASPLGAACSRGKLESIRWLIAHGAILDPPGAQITPVQSALGKMNCEAAALLLDAGLPVEKAAWGVIAGASLGRLDVIQWLLGRGVQLDRSYPGLGVLRDKALATAEKEGKKEIARFLRGELDPGPPPAQPPPSSPLFKEKPRAAPEDRARLLEEALELVRSHGKAAGRWKATGPAAPPQRMSLLSHAAGNGIAEIVAALLDAGAKTNFPNDGTPPPLHCAAEAAQVEVVRLLLERGASPKGADGKTWPPLEAAVMSGVPEVVRILLEAGANPKTKPPSGGKMADRVRGPYAEEIRNMLEEATASKASKAPR